MILPLMLLIGLALAASLPGSATGCLTQVTPATFTNPVAKSGQDPWVIHHDGMYHYISSRTVKAPGESARRGTVQIASSASLLGVFAAEPAVAWSPLPGTRHSKELWAPELHHHGDAWYIYVAADDGDNHHHRTHVLRRTSADPRGPFEHVGELELPDDRWSIDATLGEIDGQLYCAWSGWPGSENVTQNLYLCRMEDPVTPIGERALISRPELEWELRGGRPGLPTVNEGPSFLQHEGRTFVIYSASGSWSDFYCLGLLELVGKDPMAPGAWRKHPQVWFASGNGVTAPGHASITTSPDGAEHWLVHHAAKHPGAGWNRQVHLQRLRFDDETGLPVAGEPLAPAQPVPVPSGETIETR
ncbi:family 43 glycosylhydrolase [Saltatorellus ferox]